MYYMLQIQRNTRSLKIVRNSLSEPQAPFFISLYKYALENKNKGTAHTIYSYSKIVLISTIRTLEY